MNVKMSGVGGGPFLCGIRRRGEAGDRGGGGEVLFCKKRPQKRRGEKEESHYRRTSKSCHKILRGTVKGIKKKSSSKAKEIIPSKGQRTSLLKKRFHSQSGGDPKNKRKRFQENGV